MRTQVAIVGAGPAGLTIANVLLAAGVDCVVIEHRSRAHVESRQRAGFLENRTVEALNSHGLADRLLATARPSGSCEFHCEGARLVVPYGDLTGRRHHVYPQHLLVGDLIRSFVARSGRILFGHRATALNDSTLSLAHGTSTVDLHADVVVGCDGRMGLCRQEMLRTAAAVGREYDYGWLTAVAEVEPNDLGAVYSLHEDGFACHIPRGPELSRFYLQCAKSDQTGDWPEDRFWRVLRHRMVTSDWAPPSGRVVEQSFLELRTSVITPMARHGLALAGDAAHVLTPAGAKGMNLAIADAVDLAGCLVSWCRTGDRTELDGYSERRLRDVWQAQEFSDWMLSLFCPPDEAFGRRLQVARFHRLADSATFATAFGEMYVG